MERPPNRVGILQLEPEQSLNCRPVLHSPSLAWLSYRQHSVNWDSASC
jgi:hypothetical protein